MLKRFSLVCLGFTLSGVLGCAADVAPTDTGDHGPALAEQTAEAQSFEVQLSRDVTAETVIPAIVEAARGQLAAVCEVTPGVAFRISNPLALGRLRGCLVCVDPLRRGDGGDELGNREQHR
jgi:hypothetical protein